MKISKLTIFLFLLAPITSALRAEEKTRLEEAKAMFADQPALHRQVQLKIFEAFENRREAFGKKGKAFYDEHHLDPKKFIVLAALKNFFNRSIYHQDKVEMLTRNKRSFLQLIDRTEEEDREEYYAEKLAEVERELADRLAWAEAIKTPEKAIPEDKWPSFLQADLDRVAEEGIGALGVSGEYLQAVDLAPYREKFKQEGLARVAHLGGNAENFATFYAEVQVESMLHKGATSAKSQTLAITLWNQSGKDLKKAQALLEKHKKTSKRPF